MTTVGTGQYTYEVIESWGDLPAGWSFGPVMGVAVDSADRVYAGRQAQDPPILVFDRTSSSGDRPVEYTVSRYRGDRYELHMSLDRSWA